MPRPSRLRAGDGGGLGRLSVAAEPAEDQRASRLVVAEDHGRRFPKSVEEPASRERACWAAWVGVRPLPTRQRWPTQAEA